MTAMNSNNESELKSCLEVALANENLDNLSIEIVGSTEKGSGYVSETLFATAKGNAKSGEEKEYNLALKCTKSSTALSDPSSPTFQSSINESYVYEKIFPKFTQFQLNRGIEKPFDSVPKCYGVFSGENKVVIALQNLKKIGYDLWDQKKPLTRDHINLVMGEYAKYHATSVAIKEQEPEKFQELASGLLDVFASFIENTGFIEVLEKIVEELGDLLKGNVERDILEKWVKFKNSVRSILSGINQNVGGLKVIIHGDSWNNNFMYKYENESKTNVLKVAIIDWQIATLSSPIRDLSYFLFSASSREDIEDIPTILKNYHSSFSSYLERLGTDPAIYPFESFLNEWKKYAKYGIVMCLLPIKVSFTDKDDIPDMAKSAEEGEDLAASFYFNIKDATGYKNRMTPIVQYGVESGIIY